MSAKTAQYPESENVGRTFTFVTYWLSDFFVCKSNLPRNIRLVVVSVSQAVKTK